MWRAISPQVLLADFLEAMRGTSRRVCWYFLCSGTGTLKRLMKNVLNQFPIATNANFQYIYCDGDPKAIQTGLLGLVGDVPMGGRPEERALQILVSVFSRVL